MNFTDAHHARAQCTPIRSRPSRRLRGLSPSRRLLLQVGAMSACGSISARAIVTTELISEATRLQGLGKVRANGVLGLGFGFGLGLGLGLGLPVAQKKPKAPPSPPVLPTVRSIT